MTTTNLSGVESRLAEAKPAGIEAQEVLREGHSPLAGASGQGTPQARNLAESPTRVEVVRGPRRTTPHPPMGPPPAVGGEAVPVEEDLGAQGLHLMGWSFSLLLFYLISLYFARHHVVPWYVKDLSMMLEWIPRAHVEMGAEADYWLISVIVARLRGWCDAARAAWVGDASFQAPSFRYVKAPAMVHAQVRSMVIDAALVVPVVFCLAFFVWGVVSWLQSWIFKPVDSATLAQLDAGVQVSGAHDPPPVSRAGTSHQ